MNILSIDTSCDETAASVTRGRRVLSNVIYSQVLIHKKWGGVVPSLAKRAHEERIDFVIEEALKRFYKLTDPATAFPPASARKKPLRAVGIPSSRATHQFTTQAMSQIDYVAVTQGPGLAIALEVGIKKAKELALIYKKKIIAVNHMEGHLYSSFAQNSKGNPIRNFKFPYLGLLVSGGHTEIVLFKDHLKYEVLGETIDDAAGEALDKAAKMLGLGYPGGPILESLAREVGNKDEYELPRPMINRKDLNFSFSGLKTSFLYLLKKMNDKEKTNKIRELASSFQEAVCDLLLIKLEHTMRQTGCARIVCGGGVMANEHVRKNLKRLVRQYSGEILFPPFKYLNTDNAAMIGIVASYKVRKDQFIKELAKLDRIPRMRLI